MCFWGDFAILRLSPDCAIDLRILGFSECDHFKVVFKSNVIPLTDYIETVLTWNNLKQEKIIDKIMIKNLMVMMILMMM